MRQVLRAGALERPRRMRWRGRWEGGSGWVTHVNPWLIHVNVWQKPLQYCKVISLQLIKINGEKKEKKSHPHFGLSFLCKADMKRPATGISNVIVARERRMGLGTYFRFTM